MTKQGLPPRSSMHFTRTVCPGSPVRGDGEVEAEVNERAGFLKLLAENEDDTTTRLVYADWLDDHGEHEEADRQRKWPAAKEWFVRFCQKNNPSPDDPDERIIPYKELIELGRGAVEQSDGKEYWFSCGSNLTMCAALRADCR